MAAAFVLMAVFLKVPWLMIPASILGFTGLVLQFCAATGWWSSWAVLWTVEPFAVGLPLLLIGIAKKIEGVKLAGIILCGLAGLAFAGHVQLPGDLPVDHTPDRTGAGAGTGHCSDRFGTREAFP